MSTRGFLYVSIRLFFTRSDARNRARALRDIEQKFCSTVTDEKIIKNEHVKKRETLI